MSRRRQGKEPATFKIDGKDAVMTRREGERRLAEAETVEECKPLLSHPNRHVAVWAWMKIRKLNGDETPLSEALAALVASSTGSVRRWAENAVSKLGAQP
jgi:hypothetical protein